MGNWDQNQYDVYNALIDAGASTEEADQIANLLYENDGQGGPEDAEAMLLFHRKHVGRDSENVKRHTVSGTRNDTH